MEIREQILAKAKAYRDYAAQTLSEMVKIPSYSSQEEAVCKMIAKACEDADLMTCVLTD